MVQRTLNEIVQFNFDRSGPFAIEYFLDSNISRRYDQTSKSTISEVLVALRFEIEQHGKCNNVKVSTSVEKDKQKVLIAWDGPLLTEDAIKSINESYAEGTNLRHTPSRHGTQIESYWLKFLNATVCIENFEDGIYKVRNILEFPNKK